MNIVYFNTPVGTTKVAFTITDKPVSELKAEGVIPNGSQTLVKPYNENMKAEESAKHTHIDKVVFDNQDNPTDIVFDLDLLKTYFLNLYKQVRANAFNVLDGYQTRALATNNTELVAEIEADKQALRDMPQSLDYSNAHTGLDVAKTYPAALLVDYEEKYKSKF